MAKKRLGVWMRLWIVLTVLWILGAGMTMFVIQANDHMERATATRELCEFLKADGLQDSRTDCWEQQRREVDAYSPVTWSNFGAVLGIAAIGAGIMWIFGLIGYFTVRWIVAGRSVPGIVAAEETPE